jgi:hypothetical protein
MSFSWNQKGPEWVLVRVVCDEDASTGRLDAGQVVMAVRDEWRCMWRAVAALRD